VPVYVLKRLAQAVPIMIGVAIVVFVTMKLIPGDPVAALLGPNSTPQSRHDLSQRLGLDQPLPIQFLNWFVSALHGDLGTSISLQRPAGSLVLASFLNTLVLLGAALLLALIGGIVLGVLAALHPQSALGRIVRGFTLFTISIPQYTVALLLLLLAVETGILPTGGMTTTGQSGPGTVLLHLILPAVAASITPMGGIARMFASSLSEVLHQDFVTSYRARGLASTAVLRHAIHGSVPALLTITGLQISYLLGGTLFIEVIFAWPGLGQLVYQAVSARDYPLVQAGVLVSALVLVLVNVVVDSAHAGFDPRVRA